MSSIREIHPTGPTHGRSFRRQRWLRSVRLSYDTRRTQISERLAELGADVVINPSEVIADSALRSLESGELEYKARQLADL
ncbi:hypothetical protein C8039_16815 [Halogeometricum sp. wsp3]|nr:hypothetical protein C8039_16815 [Halogeometricum sp. wsp3]